MESASFKKLKTLQREAERSCRFRGHDMESWARVGLEKAYSHCRDCGMQVAVDVNPLPNGIDISGRAVALHCTG